MKTIDLTSISVSNDKFSPGDNVIIGRHGYYSIGNQQNYSSVLRTQNLNQNIAHCITQEFLTVSEIIRLYGISKYYEIFPDELKNLENVLTCQ